MKNPHYKKIYTVKILNRKLKPWKRILKKKNLDAAITSKDQELYESRCSTAKEISSDTQEAIDEEDSSCYKCQFVGRTKTGRVIKKNNFRKYILCYILLTI